MGKVTLTEDQKAVLLKDTKDMFFAAKQLHDWVQSESLEQQMAGTLPSLIEFHLMSIAKVLNYESHLTKEHEQRHIEIRNANQRIRDLEKQLASSKPIEGLGEQLSLLKDLVYDWWKEEGFRHVSEVSFTSGGGMKVEFSFMLDTCRDALIDDAPVTNQQKKVKKLKRLVNTGFELVRESEDSSQWNVLDTQNNRRLLAEMLEKRFPSICISKIESWARGGKRNNDVWTIWRLEAYIQDLRDIPITEVQS